ncbi:alpha-N-acetyl-neuraminyl-2,3-beta-galactosyl-1,3-N-acetyl-galactosaminide alpha-2,6-sialyltransferase [Gouania willdenowi]|uniref:Alpha-N-acetylgalactosaminide alpha-2,6-sialyltransferase 3-like n=1 Tax=Gouania willdenowi TaxID=441366 RepID=A0A8C5E8H5_GOUWI|nr:alpha-N-acetylgalactosaminide alpha-2,6-sialyltransferase 3-like [Gouania willdenowi]
MRIRMIKWLFFFSLSLTLFWFSHVITQDSLSLAEHSRVLQNYQRIGNGSVEQRFLSLHCNQCALVSSSGQMLGAGAGEEIDQIECVIRMNNAPTKGFEKDVGSSSSVRVVAHTSVSILMKNEKDHFQDSPETTYVFWGPERNMRQDGKARVFNNIQKLANKYPHMGIYVFTSDKVKYCDGVFQKETGKDRKKSGAYLSTGFFSMILAREMCDSIIVYGMIDDGYCSRRDRSNIPYHYYEKYKLHECAMYRSHERFKRGGHRFITEKSIFARWAKQHQIVFKHPSWNL